VNAGIAGVLAERCSRAGIDIPDSLGEKLLVFYELLARWNRTINLTSLSDPSEAVDRLLLEPVAASAYLPRDEVLIDLGSGGGSPAVPLALSSGATRLVMVESRVRKAAFLREALRELGLEGSVETIRFEELRHRQEFSEAFGLVSVRAVRLDAALFAATTSLLRENGLAGLFRPAQDAALATSQLPPTLSWRSNHPLLAGASSLAILQKIESVPRGTFRSNKTTL
jgi:16S rRNA (guanine527-N7)-methyltransferase